MLKYFQAQSSVARLAALVQVLKRRRTLRRRRVLNEEQYRRVEFRPKLWYCSFERAAQLLEQSRHVARAEPTAQASEMLFSVC